jgi:hypothetical protein
VLSERLVTNWYPYDQRIHGELKQRAEAELQAQNTVGQMKQLGGKYTEVELVKSDRVDGKANRAAEHGVRLDNDEWSRTVQNLATTFNQPRSRFFNGRDPAIAGSRSLDLAEEYQTLPVGKLGSLREDDTRFYATAILNKGNNHLKLATVSWLKEPLDFWLARAENRAPKAVAIPGGDYQLPKISEGGCIEDTWMPTAGPLEARVLHTAVRTGNEMIVWGGSIFGANVENSGGRYCAQSGPTPTPSPTPTPCIGRCEPTPRPRPTPRTRPTPP